MYLFQLPFKIFFIIDVYSNKQILSYLSKSNKVVFGSPINNYFYRLITYPLIPSNFIFIFNFFYIIDLIYFFYMIYALKKNFKKLITSNIV